MVFEGLFFMNEIEQELNNFQKKSLYRSEKRFENYGNEISLQNKQYINFSSNDYLNLSQHKKLLKYSQEFLKRYGTGATASVLVCGYTDAYRLVEDEVKKLKKTKASMLFSTGYMANIGIITSLADKNTILYLDRLSHASLIDGVRQSGAKFRRFTHNSVENLEQLLKKDLQIKRKIIITESVFSMDGDRAPLLEILALAKKYTAYLVVDEAHATGVFGKQGCGLASAAGINKYAKSCIIGTFGKALGSFGAYIACSVIMKKYLVNKARSYIYTTGLPPSVLGSMYGAFQVLKENPEMGIKVLVKADHFRKTLRNYNIPVIPGDTQIISVITGTVKKTLHLSKDLFKNGILGIAIRPPTVPKGTARIRFTINYAHTEKQMKILISLLHTYNHRYGI
jgi:8-amino-7-oxononanoate synthase